MPYDVQEFFMAGLFHVIDFLKSLVLYIFIRQSNNFSFNEN